MLTQTMILPVSLFFSNSTNLLFLLCSSKSQQVNYISTVLFNELNFYFYLLLSFLTHIKITIAVAIRNPAKNTDGFDTHSQK